MKALVIFIFTFTFSPAVFAGNCPADQFCAGDQVLKGDSIREIEFLDTTGRVALKENSRYYRTFTTVHEITKLVECHGLYCKRDVVLKGNTIRTIEFLDNTGRLVLQETSGYYRTFTTARAVSKLVDCYRDFCNGDGVLKGKSIRTVEALDDTGRVVLMETRGYYRTYTTMRAITKLVDCHGEYCKGDEVLLGNAVRTIEYLDDTGRVVLEETSGYYRTYTEARKITMIKRCWRHRHRR